MILQIKLLQNLDLGIYILFALLLAILTSLSAIEILFVKDGRSKQITENMKRSAQWSVLGVVLTIVAGAIAQLNTTENILDISLLLLPIFFMGRWAIWYIKYSKVTEDLLVIKKDIDETFKKAIRDGLYDIAYDRFDASKGISKNGDGYTNRISIFILCQEKLKAYTTISSIASKVKTYPILSDFRDFYDVLIFDLEKLDSCLLTMEKEIEIITNPKHENLYRLTQLYPQPQRLEL